MKVKSKLPSILSKVKHKTKVVASALIRLTFCLLVVWSYLYVFIIHR